jgi:hypothetical protein
MQLVEVSPRLDMLPQLLGRPYSLEDEEDATAAAAAGDAAGDGADDMMDAEGPGSADPSSSRCGCTTEQLLSKVQVRALGADYPAVSMLLLCPSCCLQQPAAPGAAAS